MKEATLQKTIRIIKADLFMEIKRPVKRQDIRDFLIQVQNGKLKQKDVNDRVCQYLQKRGLLSRDNTVTDQGQSTIESSLVYEPECGKYGIEYCEDKRFLGTRIINFKRVNPSLNNNGNTGNNRNPQDKIYFSEGEHYSGRETFTIKKHLPAAISSRHENNITVKWQWQGLESSKVTINGKTFPWTNGKENLESWLKDIAKENGYSWNSEEQKLEVPLEEVGILDNNALEFFKKDIRWQQGRGFNDVSITDIKLMPLNADAAVEWLNLWLTKCLQKDYMNQVEFKQLESAFVNDSILFKYDFESYPPENFLDDELRKAGKTKQSAAFWHLAAPMDLNPDKVATVDFALVPGEKKTLGEIAESLVGDFEPEQLFYIDRYVYTSKQQRTFSALVASLNEFGIEKTILITDKFPKQKNRSKWIDNNDKHIKTHDLHEILNGSKPNHSRYLVLVDSESQWRTWSISDSMDFIQFDRNTDITPQSQGETRDVSFSRTKPEALRLPIRQFIEDNI